MSEYKPIMEITVRENECWVCGETKSFITSHHTLPKHMKPKKNFVVPICEPCHKKINENDARGIIAFAYKIQKSFQELGNMVRNMTTNLKTRGHNEKMRRQEKKKQEGAEAEVYMLHGNKVETKRVRRTDLEQEDENT